MTGLVCGLIFLIDFYLKKCSCLCGFCFVCFLTGGDESGMLKWINSFTLGIRNVQTVVEISAPLFGHHVCAKFTFFWPTTVGKEESMRDLGKGRRHGLGG